MNGDIYDGDDSGWHEAHDELEPSDVGGNVGADVVNGPQWAPADGKVGVVPGPGVNSQTAEFTGLIPGTTTVAITGLQAVEGGAVVTETVTAVVTTGVLHHFAPTAGPLAPA